MAPNISEGAETMIVQAKTNALDAFSQRMTYNVDDIEKFIEDALTEGAVRVKVIREPRQEGEQKGPWFITWYK